ncbi:MAG: hypothetical protein OEZ54_01845, partial [Gemmatimonadota bacterium]|nr:hypothetical protein [Gemmatimonadota bacterium]
AVQLPMLGHLLTGSKGPAVSKAVYRLGLMVGGLSIVSFVGLVWAFKNAHEIAGYVTSLENRWSLSALIPAAAVVDAAYALRLPVLGLWAVGIVLGTVFGYFLFNVWCSTHLPRLLGQRDGGPGVAKMNRHRFEEFFVLRHAWASVWLKDFLQTARLRADLIWLWLLSVSVAGVASAWIVAGSIRSEVISAAVGGMVVKSGLLVILLVLAVRTGAGSLGQERKTATLLRMSPVGVRLPIIKALNNLAAMTITYFVFVTTALVAFSYLGVYGVLNANDLVAVYLAAAFSVLASVSAGFLYPDFSCKNVFLPGGKLLGAWVAAVVAAPVMVLGSLPATGGLPRAGVLVSLLGLGVVILNMLGHRWRYVEVP